jgi:hypothetical protein
MLTNIMFDKIFPAASPTVMVSSKSILFPLEMDEKGCLGVKGSFLLSVML